MDRRRFIAAAGAAGTSLQWPLGAFAQAGEWPREPVRVIVPYSAGGPTEVAGRVLAQELTKNLGHNFLIDLRPGGNSVIGTDVVARARPDGHTLLMQAAAFAINPSLIQKLPFDTVADFEPLTMATRSGLMLLTQASSPINTVADVLAFARAKPGMAQFASAGNGSMSHMSMELFAAMAKIEAVHVPYKGSGAALPDLLGGHVPFMIDNLGSAMPHVRAGKLKAIAFTGARRTDMLPGVPTIAETPALAGYETSNWFGFLAPAKMPAALSERIHGELVKAIRKPEIVERFAKDGVEAVGNSRAEFAAFLKGEMSKWAKVIKERGIKAD
ncbi:MAG: tripartite tricarboxylate transporter substrate binding protein [Proteobacteria bacterium]|nr:tripartite tricarboxylate transporter substrate binding protein [Burkholderiales bacterium]